MDNNLSRNNHYVAQMYLNTWKNDYNKVFEYKLLVPHENYNIWNPKAIKSIAREENFYIRIKGDNEIDDIEKWLNEEFETPVKNSLDKAIQEKKLDSEDWRKLINYIACQIVRTPAFLQTFLDKSKKTLPEVFEDTVRKIGKELSEKHVMETIKKTKEKEPKENHELFPIKITNTGISDGENTLLKVETVIGKSLYLDTLKHYLTKTLEVLHKHRWQVIKLDDKVIIPTSDDPVICLNYYNSKKYDFGGGWGNKGSEIIFPISPNRIIYTHIGYKQKIETNYELSALIKKLIIEHAHRKIFASFEDAEVIKQRKRYVNAEEFEREKTVFENFHEDYKNIEKDYLKHGGVTS